VNPADVVEAYAAYRPRLVAAAARVLVTDPDAAHDVVQDVFARALRPEVELHSYAGWRQAVVNAAISRIRNARPRQDPNWLGQLRPLPEGDHADQTCEAVDAEPIVRRVRAAVEVLPEEQRLIINMRYRLGATNNEVAAHFGVGKSETSRRHTWALNALRTALTEPVAS
jgi:RNA polymerase sigma factor (sigma-70 family)